MDLDSINRRIGHKLSSLTDTLDITIAYACESGSRAWGFPSPDSDYDVRFIYRHSKDWYLQLHEGRDVIDVPIESTPDGVLDLGGWDLRKTLRLAAKSNPVLWEWLQSPICYQKGAFFDCEHFRRAIDLFYSPITACHHYLSICRNTVDNELTGPSVKIKKYFYMLRPLLAAIWIEQFRTVPPMELQPLLALLDDQPNIRGQIDRLLTLKQFTDEQIPIDRVAILDEFILQNLKRLRVAAQALPAGAGEPETLDRLFLAYLDA